MTNETKELARRHQPTNMGTVEAPLQQSAPRNIKWYDRDGQPIDGVEVNSFLALRSWIYQVEIETDSEGPTYSIDIAYELDGALNVLHREIGYDSYHWSISYPEHYGWFISKIKLGNALTLMIDLKDLQDVRIFGQFEAFLKQGSTVSWAAS